MNMKNIFYCLLPGLLLGACSNKVYEKTGDSVIVKVQHKETGGPRLVRLQVMGDKLIHVSATADSKVCRSAKSDCCSAEKTNIFLPSCRMAIRLQCLLKK